MLCMEASKSMVGATFPSGVAVTRQNQVPSIPTDWAVKVAVF